MNEDENEYPLGPYRSSREWHVYHVYNDPEFQQDIRELSERFISKWEANPDVQVGLTEEEEGVIAELQARYAITAFDIEMAQTGLHLQGILNTDMNLHDVTYDDESDLIVIRIHPDFPKSSMGMIWDTVEDVRTNVAGRGERGRRRGPENHKLLYAVFKARQNRWSFPKIYSAYESMTLPLYEDRRPTQFQNEDSLERDYRK
jgi:hypothetical protein